jgi:hypothetical protein
MNVTAEEIKAATKDTTSPLSSGDEMPSAGANGLPTASGTDS